MSKAIRFDFRRKQKEPETPHIVILARALTNIEKQPHQWVGDFDGLMTELCEAVLDVAGGADLYCHGGQKDEGGRCTCASCTLLRYERR